jgi:hypothetical protein
LRRGDRSGCPHRDQGLDLAGTIPGDVGRTSSYQAGSPQRQARLGARSALWNPWGAMRLIGWPKQRMPARHQVMFSIGTKVRFVEPFRPDVVAPGTVGIVVLIEPLPAVFGPPQRIRAKFGDYVSPWLMPVQLVVVD